MLELKIGVSKIQGETLKAEREIDFWRFLRCPVKEKSGWMLKTDQIGGLTPSLSPFRDHGKNSFEPYFIE